MEQSEPVEPSQDFQTAQALDMEPDLGHELDVFTELQVSVTDAQYAIITHPPAPSEVLKVHAGPGSGKTFTMTARIAHLIQNKGVQAHEILVLSMANRLVSALQEALTTILGESGSKVDILTFHSYCGSIIDQYGNTLEPDAPNRKILDKNGFHNWAVFFLGKWILLGGVTLRGTITPTQLENLLADVTRGRLTASQAARNHGINVEYIEAILHYFKHHGMIGYDDLIKHALQLIEKSKRHHEQADPEDMSMHLLPRIASYKAIFVDEYQDIYPLLMSVVKAIAYYPTFGQEGYKHLTIAGDPNQSIYGFLGSRSDAMDTLHEDLPGMNIVEKPLPESFRCTQEILDAAVDICLRCNNTQPSVPLTSMRNTPKMLPMVIQETSQDAEFEFIAQEIVRLLCSLGGLLNPKDIAVLTKTNMEAEKFQSLLKERCGLKSYKISQGNLWVRARTHVFLDILSVISGDSDASFRMLCMLAVIDRARGARARAAKVFDASSTASAGNPNFLEDYLYEGLSNKHSYVQKIYKSYPDELENIARFVNEVQIQRENIERLHSSCATDYTPVEVVKCLAAMVKIPGIGDYLSKPTKGAVMSDVLESFNNSLHQSFDHYVAHKDLHERTFVDYFLQCYDNEVPAPYENLVQVSTIHSAKGLEFPVVFVTGLSNYKPHWDGILSREGDFPYDATNARLMYVAFTRARDLLYVGSGKPFEELSAASKRVLTYTLPDLETSEDNVEIPKTGMEEKKHLKIVQSTEGLEDATISDTASGTSEIGEREIVGALCNASKSWPIPETVIDSEKFANLAVQTGPIKMLKPSVFQKGETPTTLLHALSIDLNRRLPSPQKLELGRKYYSEFRQPNFRPHTLKPHIPALARASKSLLQSLKR